MNRIFYIDDDYEDFEIFSAALKELQEKYLYQYDLTYYSNASELMTDLKKSKPENILVFLDVNMPVSGFEILAKIRRNVYLKGLPVIMYSTASDANTINISNDLGASLYAVKPSSIKELADLLKRVLSINWSEFEATKKNFRIN